MRRLEAIGGKAELKIYYMKKEHIYRLRAIIQELKNLDDNDRDMMAKDKMRILFDEGVALCNDYIDRMKPL